MTKILFFLVILNTNIIFPQSVQTFSFANYVLDDSLKEGISLPKFDIHIAAGLIAGVRTGVRYLFTDNFSTEIAFGFDIRNFISLSDFQRRYSLGLNYNLEGSNGAISLLTTYVEQPGSVHEGIFFSPGFGFIPIREVGVRTFIRVGIGLEYSKNYLTNTWKFIGVTPNLDIGVSFVF